MPFPAYWALLPTLGAAGLILSGMSCQLNQVVLASKPFVALGLISYPLYLWHWPVLSFARIINSQTPSLEVRGLLVDSRRHVAHGGECVFHHDGTHRFFSDVCVVGHGFILGLAQKMAMVILACAAIDWIHVVCCVSQVSTTHHTSDQ